MSTMPAFQGGLQPVARTTAFGRVRRRSTPTTSARFAVWSGTSFAAPLMAGAVAAALLEEPESSVEPDGRLRRPLAGTGLGRG